MDPLRGITVEIISNGQVLNLYDDPDAAGVHESRSRNHYVEAVAGSTFQVKVKLNNEFDTTEMYNKNLVDITVKIDGRDDSSLYSYYGKKDLKKTVALGKSVDFVFTGPSEFCKDTGRWMLTDYCFGNLDLKETSDPRISINQARDIGKVQIIIRRVSIVDRHVSWIQSKEPLETMNELPEKALKGRAIDTTVRFANARPTRPPAPETKEFLPIGGKAGEPMVFNIFYRSRRALQILGCIPRTPSAEPPITNDHSARTEGVMQEVRDLRARLALLERGINVKSETPSATVTGLKRERDEDVAEVSHHQKRRQTPAVKIEHIDLTDD